MRSKARIIARPKYVVLWVFALLTFASSQSAAAWFLPLGPEAENGSDITANFIAGGYHQPSGKFTAAGFAMGFNDGLFGNPTLDPDYSFLSSYEIDIYDLQESVPGDGTFSSGTLKLTLDTSDPANTSELPPAYAVGPDLLTGNIIDVLFTGAGNLELLFEVTGGTAVPSFGGLGAHGGIKLTMDNSAARFNESFEFGNADADTLGVVPEPTSLAMLGGCAVVGSLIMAVCRRIRRAG
jgi:hypothetical protein